VKYLYVVLIAAVIIPLRIWIFRKRRSRRRHEDLTRNSTDGARQISNIGSRPTLDVHRTPSWRALEGVLGDVGLVASREIKERVRGRIFRVGTLIILAVVAAAIIIPSLHSGGAITTQTVGVVGGLSPSVRQAVHTAGTQNQDAVRFVMESTLPAARADLRSGRIDMAIIDSNRVLLNQPASSQSSPADLSLVQTIAEYLGVLKAYQAAGLTDAQATQVAHAKPVPVQTLEPSSKGTTKTTSIVGLVLLFLMLNQYNTWILIGVMQEKSSRVVEVLLAAVRPIQLLGGKVLGIGLVALAQATLIVGFALIVATAVGSDLLHGTAPLVLVCQLLWLVLGYAFYCWVYAAAGSMAERQDQVQTLALPLSIPILVGYIFSITVASSGNSDLFYKILAYLPPTAPFCMPVLVGLHQVTWWEFLASVLLTVAGTFAMAIFAARIYRRAVLHTGGRVKMRELIVRGAR